MTLAQNTKQRLLDFMRAPGYRPQKDHHLAKHLGLHVKDRAAFRSLLQKLATEGTVVKKKGNAWDLAKTNPQAQGTLSLSPRGHGFVRLSAPVNGQSELFIPPGNAGGALHGDTVLCDILPAKSFRSSRGGRKDDFKPEARVVKILVHKKQVAVGRLMKSSMYWYVIPDSPRMPSNIYVTPPPPKLRKVLAQGSHKVVVRLTDSMDPEKLTGEIMEDLGDPDGAGVDVLSILREHEIPETFTAATEKESREKDRELTDLDIAGRLDLRQDMILTIDPSDARDHDDAVSLEINSKGERILGVHIADVSHFVTPHSAIDKDARAHGNSVYMVDRFIPMLPPYLTSEVCSLKAGRDRLAYSVFITYNAKCRVTSVKMGPSVIHPRKLLDYERVQKIISGEQDPDLPAAMVKKLLQMNELAMALRTLRMRNGAMDLSMPEISCKLDDDGVPVSITRRTAAEAYHLIEEFMLAANVAVADRLSASGHPAIYRIHDEPSEDQWFQMSADLKQIGVNEAPTDRADAQRILNTYADKPLAYPVSIAILRNFMRAVYSTSCTEHFGLAFEKYTHFTSPIRRYSDLVVHRILKSLDEGRESFYSQAECEKLAEHCSQRERESAEAEEESLIIKRIQYYALQMRKKNTGPWPALITGGTSRGLLVEIVDTLQRGFVPLHTLPDPSAKHDRSTGYITGRKGRKLARIGDVIPVELIRVDEQKRMIELSWVDRPNQPQKRSSAGGKAASAKRKIRGKSQRKR